VAGLVEASEIKYYGGDQNSYNFKMLQHALSYQKDKNYKISRYFSYMPKQRAFQRLADRDGLDVVYGGATIEREQLNQPIRIPLLKGLNGWRIPLVKKSNANLILQQTSLTEFKNLLAGQFHLWSDVAILESNNLKVHKATNATGIFQMLEKGRFDYFPRSVLEIWPEMERHKHLDIMIEQHTLIHYPSAYYFYVNKQNQALADDIKQGLELALQDGSFDALFTQHYGEEIKKARQTPRKTYRLSNPFLSAETPLHRKELWIDLGVPKD
jgi:hypothetical protein